MGETSNLAIQTFLDVQQVKAMFQYAKISLWEANTQYDFGKPVTYQNRLYITALSHLSGNTFDVTKFNTIQASSVDPANIPVSSTSFVGTNLVEVLGELLSKTQSVSPSIIPVDSDDFTATNLGGVLTELYNASKTVPPSRVPVSSDNFTSTDLGGVLAELYNASHTVAPSRIPITDNNFVSTDLGGALNELFTSASNGKGAIATAITGKGGVALSSDTFTQLATAITNLASGGSTLSKVTKLNVSAPYTKTIVLENARTLDNLCAFVLEFQQSTGVSQYLVAFNNGDASNFTFNGTYVLFDGYMKLKDSYSDAMTDSGVLGSGHLYESPAITVADFNSIESFIANESTLGYVAVPKAQIIKANADINLTGVESLDSISIINVASGGGSSLMAVSVDSGVTYKTYNGNSWITVDTTSISDFKSKGMSKSLVESLSSNVLGTLRGASNTVRFAYLLERPTYSAVAYNDQLQLLVTMPGTHIVADKNKYTTSYNAGTKTISINFVTGGTYSINYAD